MRLRRSLSFRLALASVAGAALAAGAPALGATPAPDPVAGAAAAYAGTHFGDRNIPAGCIVDRDERNPDNECFHMRVGLNALDSPQVNVAVLIPVSPAAERDLRLARQAVEMWGGGIDHLARQMGLDWLAKGVDFKVTTKLVPVDANGLPTQAIRLVQPKIVVIATNPVGGIGIGIDPVDFTNQIGIFGENGVPCASIANPFSMAAWHERPGFDGHHGAMGGYFTQRCDGPGGQVCFAVNGAVDPVPGKTDFFSLYDLVSHEVGHCLTLGHVGDGSEGPWGQLPTNDIMAYSSDPVDRAKCVSTLDVEGFALQMSNYLDTNGDRKVDGKDVLVPNDKAGDALNSFQVQNPKDHWYASSTGLPEDCPQPDWREVPLADETDWEPHTVRARTPTLSLRSTKAAAGRLSWEATASWTGPRQAPPVGTANVVDGTGDGTLPMTDITGFTASVTPTAVKATIKVDRLWPTTEGGRVTAFGLYVGGRKFDSFVITQGASSDVQTIDSGARHIMPPGTSTWDTAAGTVTFTIPRSYLAAQRIHAPYPVFVASGVHVRTKDWVMGLDRAPATGSVRLSAPPLAEPVRDAPLARKASTRVVQLRHPSGNTFTPADTSTHGVPLVPQVGNVHQVPLPITQQATAAVTLTWDDPGSLLGLSVRGGSGQVVKSGDRSVTVTVPWAHRELSVHVNPSMVGASSVGYKLTARLTTLTANADRDGVPDIADVCRTKHGPVTSGGCPDTDRDGVIDIEDRCATRAGSSSDGCPTPRTERVIAYVDGKQVAVSYLMSRHGGYAFAGSARAKRGTHTLKLVWYSGAEVVQSVTRTISVR